jgi:hypothetical protein
MLDKKKIVFIDIDGVLKPWKCEDNFYEPSVDALNKIIDLTDCELVVSSDWRMTRSVSELQDIFKKQKVTNLPIAKTRLSSRYDDLVNTRPHEIVDFIECMDIKIFAVIDDMPLRWNQVPNEDFYKKSLSVKNISEWFQESFFRITDDEIGLKNEDVDKIVNHLNRKIV